MAAHPFDGKIGLLDVGAQAIDVTPENCAGKHVGSEVAVTAFAATERHGDVESQGHC